MSLSAEDIVKKVVAPIVAQGDAVLYLGAGFSVGATGQNGATIPVTGELASRLKTRLRLPEGESADIGALFQLAKTRDEKGFIEFLREQFTTDRATAWQASAFLHRWRRIYTTNIDNVLEQGLSSLDGAVRAELDVSFHNYYDPRPVELHELSLPVVHLHGSIVKASDGFVFSGSEYGANAARGADWLHEAAFDLTYRTVIMVGSRFREPDLEAALARRAAAHPNGERHRQSFMVLPKFSAIDREVCGSRGIEPIECSAEQFFDWLREANPELTSREDFLRARYPHLELIGSDRRALQSASWFAGSFTHVDTALRKAKARAARKILSKYFDGEEPAWEYIASDVPGEVRAVGEIVRSVDGFFASGDSRMRVIAIHGPSGTGKSTVLRMVLRHFSRTVAKVYQFDGEGGVEPTMLARTIAAAGGKWIIGFDRASEFYYAPRQLSNELARLDVPADTRVAIFLEERTNRHRKYAYQVEPIELSTFEVRHLKLPDAETIVDALERQNYLNDLGRLPTSQRAAVLMRRAEGRNGDLLVSLRELTRGKGFDEIMRSDLSELEGAARAVYMLCCTVGQVGQRLRFHDVVGLTRFASSQVVDLLEGDLAGRVELQATGGHLAVRHPMVAEFHFKSGASPVERKRLIADVLSYMAARFSITDVKHHPLEYRVFRELILHRWLYEVLGGDSALVTGIYEGLQDACGANGLYWLQFGKHLHDMRRFSEAEHCLRKGQAVYRDNADVDSVQLNHALGELLVDWFVQEPDRPVESLEEGVQILRTQAAQRPTDPYPLDTLARLLAQLLESREDMRGYYVVLREALVKAREFHPEDRVLQERCRVWLSRAHLYR